MVDREIASNKSQQIAVKLYDRWVRQRQQRGDITCSDNEKEVERLARANFQAQVVEPRKRHLSDLKQVAGSMTMADRVALLVMMELPVLETSTLLHRLSRQLAEDPEAKYFSTVNLRDNCGSGCG
jgi:hypothetical protein